MEIKGKNYKKITKKFSEAGPTDTINWKHKNGSVFYVKGILSKLDKQGYQYFAVNGKWVKC